MPDGESHDRLRVAILISTSRCFVDPGAADWIATRARQRADFEVDVIDLEDACLPEVAPVAGRPTPHAVQDLAPWLAAADAFIILVPDDGDNVPASLRSAIEWYREEWSAKPVSFITYGALSCRVHTVEHLRKVFVGLDAAIIRHSISLGSSHDCEADADAMLDQLGWWAQTLRAGRATRPYGT